MLFLLSLCLLGVSSTFAATISVKNAQEFQNALSQVKPGDTIHLTDGEYHGIFEAHVSGSSGQPIVLTGSRKALISSTNYGLHLDGVQYWTLKGFTIQNSKKGLVLDNSSHNTIDDVEVHHIEDEGIHFRKGSSDNVLQNSYVHNTGLKQPGFGEGVYIGSAVSNWEDQKPDHADRNKILNNKIGPNVAAESIDIKEGTCCGIITGNHFDGTGMTGENSGDSWIDLKGDKYTIENNEGVNSLTDGIQVHHVSTAVTGLKADGHGLLSGCHNTIAHQKCSGIHGKCVAVSIQHNTVLVADDCPNEVTE